MGLGKTVQAIATIWLLIRQGPYGGRPVIQRCLIVTPGTLVQVIGLFFLIQLNLTNFFGFYHIFCLSSLIYTMLELAKGILQMVRS